MINESFLQNFSDKIINKTCDYMRFALPSSSQDFDSILDELDCDNNSTSYREVLGIYVSFTKIRTPRGFALLMATAFMERSVSLFFYEKYNLTTATQFGYSARFDVYSSAFRFYYLQSMTLPFILETVISIIPDSYSITRFDIALDMSLDYTGQIISNPDLIFNMRADTRKNIVKMKHTYYVGNNSGFTRFYRVYNKSNDIKKNHKEFLYPDLLDGPVTRIEAQYGSKYRLNSIYTWLSIYFPEENKSGNFFITPIIPSYETRSLSVNESFEKTINKALKYGLSRKEIISCFESILKEYYS